MKRQDDLSHLDNHERVSGSGAKGGHAQGLSFCWLPAFGSARRRRERKSARLKWWRRASSCPSLSASAHSHSFGLLWGEELPQAILAVIAMVVFQQYSGMLLASSIPEYCWNTTCEPRHLRWQSLGYSSSTRGCCLQAAFRSTAGIPPVNLVISGGNRCGIPAVLGDAACKQHSGVLLEYHL